MSFNIVSGVQSGSGGGVVNGVTGILEIKQITISNNTASAEGPYGQDGGGRARAGGQE